jgi:nucleoside-diphosphate kinase
MQKSSRTVIIIVIVGIVSALLLYGLKKGFTQETSMAERTFAMIKPDAIAAKNSGKIIDLIERNGFTIVRMEKAQLGKQQAQEFYAVHKDRPFFDELVSFVTSGPVIVMALEKENAIKAWRDLMGATDPQKAAEGTIRKQFGTNIGNNATHGSDAPETAKVELGLFFPDLR